jgi:uncharacterized protein YjbJ (UPF0337 family)
VGELIDKAKGRAKRVAGAATNDKDLEAEGAMDETKGNVKGAFEDAKHGIKEGKEKVKRALRSEPPR